MFRHRPSFKNMEVAKNIFNMILLALVLITLTMSILSLAIWLYFLGELLALFLLSISQLILAFSVFVKGLLWNINIEHKHLNLASSGSVQCLHQERVSNVCNEVMNYEQLVVNIGR